MRKTLLAALACLFVLNACLFSPSTSEAKNTSSYFLSHLTVDVDKSLKVVKQTPETIQATKNISEVFIIKRQTLDVDNIQFKHLRTTIKEGKAISVFSQIYDGKVASDNLMVVMEPQGEEHWVVVSVDAQ